MLSSTTLYLSFVYGVLYLVGRHPISHADKKLFEAFPAVFGQIHGMNALQIGLAFLGFFMGCVVGALFQIFVENKRLVKVMRANDGHIQPEQRLRLTMYAAPLLVVSLFWFAWTSFDFVSPFSPIFAAALFGTANFFVFVRTKEHRLHAYSTVQSDGFPG